MSGLLERADQAISVTELARSAKNVFDRLTSGRQDRYVVMRKNAPAAVVLPVEEYEALMEELEDLRIEAVAAGRLADLDTAPLISHEEMMARYREGNEE